MANNVKIIKSVQFSAIRNYLAGLDADEVLGVVEVKEAKVDYTARMAVEMIDHEIELLTAKKKPSPKQVSEQEVRKNRADMVMEFLRDHKDEKFTISELQRKVPGLPAEINTSAVTALFRLPVLIQHSKRTVDKGRPYYQYVE